MMALADPAESQIVSWPPSASSNGTRMCATGMAGVVPADVSTALARNVLGACGPPPSGLSADENRTYEQLNFFYTKGIGYGIEMITQPQTLYGIAGLTRRRPAA